jgi:protease-4
VEPLAQGRVWLGSEARDRGLIDDIGGIDKAVELVKAKAKIPAGDRVTLVPYPPKRTLWEQYLRSTSEQSVEATIRGVLGGFDYRLWEQGGVMRIMPYTIDIQ